MVAASNREITISLGLILTPKKIFDFKAKSERLQQDLDFTNILEFK